MVTSGVVSINDNSDLVLQASEAAIAQALEAIGLTAEAEAKKLCAVDTGRLRNSITHTARDHAVYIGTNVEYAVYVEMGTVRTRAQPYLRPAIMDHIAQYKRIAMTYLKGG